MSGPPIFPLTSLPIVAIGRCAAGPLGLSLLLSALSDDGAIAQVTDINVTAATNSADYSILATASDAYGQALSALVEYTSDGSASQTEIRDGLLAAWDAHPVAGMLGSLAAGSNKLVFTASRGGAVYTVTFSFPDNPSTDLTQTAVTSAADAPTYYMGRAVEITGAGNNSVVASLPSALAAPTVTYSVTHGAGATYTGVFTALDAYGVQRSVSWSASAGAALANTLANIETAIVSALSSFTGATASDATSPTVVVTLPLGSAQIISVSTSASGGGGSPAMTVAVDDGDELPDYVLVRDAQDTSPIRGQDPEALLPTNQGMPRPIPFVGGGGCQWVGKVVSQTGIALGRPVFVETASGASNGKLTATPSATAVPMRYQGRPALFWGVHSDSTLALVTI